MLRMKLLKIVNPLLFLALLLQISSLFFGREWFHLIHKLCGWTMLSLGLAHFLLNWNWVMAQLRPGQK